MAGEKIFTIPLREAYKKKKIKRAPYAVGIVRNYLKVHMKSSDIKLGAHLNEKLWERGPKKTARRVRVKAVMDGKTVKAELLGFDYREFRAAPKTEKKGMKERLMDRLGPKALQKAEEEKMADEGKTAQEVRKEEKAAE